MNRFGDVDTYRDWAVSIFLTLLGVLILAAGTNMVYDMWKSSFKETIEYKTAKIKAEIAEKESEYRHKELQFNFEKLDSAYKRFKRGESNK